MPDQTFQQIIDERFTELPPVLQEAITGAHVQDHMQKLAKKHDLHLDQWQKLENQVVLTLMGLAPAEGLRDAIKNKVAVTDAIADELAEAIAIEVFEPVRQEMERSLEHPAAVAKEGTPIEDMTEEIMRAAKVDTSTAPPIEAPIEALPVSHPAPATPTIAPPPRAPELPKPTVVRTEVPQTYKGNLSSERKDVHSDPYRVAPDA